MREIAKGGVSVQKEKSIRSAIKGMSPFRSTHGSLTTRINQWSKEKGGHSHMLSLSRLTSSLIKGRGKAGAVLLLKKGVEGYVEGKGKKLHS